MSDLPRRVPEFHRPIDAARAVSRGEAILVTADATERGNLARRLDLPAIHAFGGSVTVRGERRGLFAVEGSFEASVTQTCVVSMNEFRQDYAEDFVVYFIRDHSGKEPSSDAVDFDPDDDRALAEPFDGETLDLGEILAQQLSLALDPFPREPGASPPVPLAEPDEAEEAASGERPLAILKDMLNPDRK